jgi:hypothetical protein
MTYQLGLTIETRFIGPSNVRGSRISAVCKRDSDRIYRKTVNYQHALNGSDNHESACRALIDVMDADLRIDSDQADFEIVGRGYGGSNESSYYWLINRGGC